MGLSFFFVVFLVFARENTIFYGFSVGFSSGKHYFLRIPCHFLRLFLVFRRKTLFSYGFCVISLGFQKENIR